MDHRQWSRRSPLFFRSLFAVTPFFLLLNLSVFLASLRANEQTGFILTIVMFFLTLFGALLLAAFSMVLRKSQEAQALASRNLLEKDETLQTVLRNVPLILWAVDCTGFCTLYEGLGVQRLGPETPTLVGKNIFEALRHRPEILEAARKTLLGERTKIEVAFDDRWYESTLIPVYSRNGVKGLVGISMDITDRKGREVEAELANQAKSRFLANMSHEIRTPLGIILGFIDLLGATDLTEAEREKYMRKIRLNAEALAALVNDILDLSKVEAGRLDVEWADVCVKGLLHDLRESFETRAQSKGLHFSVEMPEKLPGAIRTDIMLLRQILVNLLGNAIKFTDKGSVRLVIHQHPLETPGKTQLCFQVIDTGVGMSEKHQKALFDPFSQGDPSTARRFGGTGLGLALSKRLAELLGGDLQLRSTQEGVGSVFQLNLVAEVRESAEMPAPKAAREKPGLERSSLLQDVRILLVEDAVDNQALVGTLLRRNGAYVDFASDGREGVEKALAENWDLVLMDIQMPGMDGFEATRRLRERAFRSPILALTAHALREERDRALGAGFDGYLTKPIDRAELISKIEACVRTRTSVQPPRPALDLRQEGPESLGFSTI